MAVGTMDDLAAHSFELVNRELANTLDAVRREIEDFVDGHAGRDSLLRAAELLHLARGALKIVEIHGAALLADEMEQTCRRLAEPSDHDKAEQGMEALTRAIVQLPAYLERLLSGGKDVALVLLPLLNDLRQARGKPSLTEGTLVLLHAGPFESHLRQHPTATLLDASRGFEKIAQRLRPPFQTALLGWIRGTDAGRNLDELLRVSSSLERAAATEPVKQLWSVLSAVLIAVRAGGLEETVTLKRLIGQADRQLKRLIDGGETALVSSPPLELVNSLLYYIARANCNDPKLQALRETFGLADMLPGEEQLDQARESLAGPSVKLMHTVAQAIKEDLGGVKDVLDIFVRTGLQDVAKLAPQLDMLKKIGDTLGVLGLEKARAQIQREMQELALATAGNKAPSESLLEKVAATLLDVEDTLDRELVRAVLPEGVSPPMDDEAQQRHVTQAVMGECVVNLAKIKESVVELVDQPGNARALDQVKPQLRGIVAGLLMLNKTKAMHVVERIGDVIATRLVPSEASFKPEHLERLADAIVSVEYYMETVRAGRTDPWYMLDNAARCLDLLERLPSAQPQQRSPEAPAAVAPPAPEARLKPPARRPSVMEIAEDRSDPELVEIFIEEAKEAIATIGQQLPLWTVDQQNSDALIAVRRSFHTLKGSGRMVGAQLIGEFAWNLENLLNRLINQTLEPNAGMVAFIAEASKALPQLIEQLEIGLRPSVDVHALMKRAEAFAEGRGMGDASPELHVVTPTESAEPESPATAAVQGMDPVLADIFVKEMRGHVAVIEDWLGALGPVGPHAVDEPLYRACHTLLGSARMAGFQPVMAIAGLLSEHLRRHFDAGSGLTDAGVAALRAACAEIAAMAEALASGRSAAADPKVAEALAALADGVPIDIERDLPMIEVPAAATAAAAEPHSVYDTRQAQAIEHAASEPPATIDFDPEIAAIFAEEAAELLEDAERSLQAIRQAQGTNGVTELQRVLHTLKGGARMAGVLPMGDLSHGLETLLARVSAASATPDAAALDLVQRTLDRLQQMRDSIDAGRMASAPADLLAELEAHGTERVSDAAGDMEEPIAAHESAEAPHVEVPAASAADREPETGGVVPAEADLAAPTFEPQSTPLATSAADADQDLAVSPQESALDATSFELEIAAGAAQVPEPTAAAPEAAEVDADTASEQVLPEPTIVEALQPLELASPLADGAPPGEPETALPRTAPEEAPAAAAPPDRRGPERAETARVDAALLDALLNGAGEINIFQSRLNQQLHSIDFHLGELGSTVARLREQLRKLEAETEAQILFRHQEDLEAGGGFDPLELDRYSTIQQLSRALAESANDVASINELLNGLTNETGTLLTQQARVTAELQNGLMRTRMVPFERHVSRLARIVRQACADTGKAAELVVEGENSLIDRQVLESMLPPFEHLLRNAVAHGIEPPQVRQQRGKPPVGKVFLKLKREGGEVLVEVTDDGGGLDLTAIRRKAVDKGLIAEQQRISDEQAVELILRPGFSTAGELTQAAGRGVGMDVVDTEIKKLGGSMRIESTPGQGARFLIRLPYTLAITHALIVNVGDETFALPLPTVEGITRLSREKILKHLTDDEPRLNHGGVAYRIQHLGSLVGAAPSALPEDENAVSLVLIRAGESSTALLTDSLEGSREIVVKTLGPHIASVPGVTGATILGDGRVIMILDPGTLVRSQKGAEPAVPPPAQHTARPLAALVVDDSITMRRVTQRLLERRGVKVLTARDGLDAITVLQDNEVDVVLLDIEMPRMDGYQFATHVRNDAQLKNLPIIMITSRSGEKHRAKAIEIGVNDYLSKPYQESQLVAAIEALLGRHL